MISRTVPNTGKGLDPVPKASMRRAKPGGRWTEEMKRVMMLVDRQESGPQTIGDRGRRDPSESCVRALEFVVETRQTLLLRGKRNAMIG
jgi:hypothetical protein